MNILDAIHDPNLFKPFLGNLSTWENWLVALRVLYGLRVHPRHKSLIQECTGRERRLMPKKGFDTAEFLTGRRSGKSRAAALIGAYEAALAGHERKLAKGEKGLVIICAPTKKQGRIVHGYLRAIFDAPLLHGEVVGETTEGFDLSNGIRIEIMAGDFRTVRGYTLVAAIVDEAAFFGYDAECKVKSDTELIRAIKPGLATVGGKLIAISNPYAKKGWTYRTWKRHCGIEGSSVLVWNCPSRTMNPTLPQAVIDAALAEDRQAALSEYGGQFRDDVAEFLPLSLIERLVIPDRKELLPKSGIAYFAFVDLGGGRVDDAALAIAHRNDRKVVIDLAKRYRAPFSPNEVILRMVEELRRYGIRRVTGDNYAAEFVAGAFRSCGMGYAKSLKPKSALYLELLPQLCSGEIELLDDEVLINQLANLERHTRAGGKDIVDHPQGSHDDVANVVAGVTVATSKRRLMVGAFQAEEQGRGRLRSWLAGKED